jgi:hypothetical protein
MLTLNLVSSTIVFAVAAWIYVVPRLGSLPPLAVLQPILLLHALRHLGMMFLSPGATMAGIPEQFTYPAAYGDLLAAVLAMIALLALRAGAGSARLLLWIFNVEGTVDLAIAISLATIHDVERFMGPAYWIPAFWVPALIVTHALVFVILLRPNLWTRRSATV